MILAKKKWSLWENAVLEDSPAILQNYLILFFWTSQYISMFMAWWIVHILLGFDNRCVGEKLHRMECCTSWCILCLKTSQYGTWYSMVHHKYPVFLLYHLCKIFVTCFCFHFNYFRCPHCDFRALMDPDDKVFMCMKENCRKVCDYKLFSIIVYITINSVQWSHDNVLFYAVKEKGENHSPWVSR